MGTLKEVIFTIQRKGRKKIGEGGFEMGGGGKWTILWLVGGGLPPIPLVGRENPDLSGTNDLKNFIIFLKLTLMIFLIFFYNEEEPQVDEKCTENDTSSLLWIYSEDFLKILYNERDKKLNQNYIAFSKKNVWANSTILDPKMVHRRKPGCNLRNFKKILNYERQL